MAVADRPPASEATETARICRELEGMSSLALLTVLERQHKGRPAGECMAARIEKLKKQQTALWPRRRSRRRGPEPAVGAFNPKRASVPLTAVEERALKPKDSFKECAECPELVVVPAGTFTMGSPPHEKERYTYEGPRRRVTIGNLRFLLWLVPTLNRFPKSQRFLLGDRIQEP